MVITLLLFVIVLGLLVFVHELGHFLVAKKTGMQVDEFGFGFPPRLVGVQRVGGKWKLVWGVRSPQHPEHTIYSVNLIPLGGFVKIVGENNDSTSHPNSFIHKGFGARFTTLIAGVLMNVVLAAILLSIGFAVGLPQGLDADLPRGAVVTDKKVIIGAVVPESPAEKAGVRPGDILNKIDQLQITEAADAQNYVRVHSGDRFHFFLTRGDRHVELSVLSIANPSPNQGPTGIEIVDIGLVRLPVFQAVVSGITAAGNGLLAVASGLVQLLTSKNAFKSLGGPVEIARFTGEAAKLGWV